MPPIATQSLHLEDTLEEDPQTKAMLDLFEKDTMTLKKFSKAFTGTCQKILNAQAFMISANQELAYYCRLYGEQEFLLQQNTATDKEKNESTENVKKSNLVSTLNEFADHIDELSTCFQVFATQLNDTMIYPLNKIVENEFDEIHNLSQLYKDRAEIQEQAIQKYLRLPNKREYDAQRHQANEEVFDSKKKFHETSMNYFTSLNMLQYKQEYMLTEPLISLFQSYKLFFKMGAETLNGETDKTLDNFLKKNTDDICAVKKQLGEEMNKNNQMIELLQQDDSIYQAEQPDFNMEDPNRYERLQKSGFLNLRSKFPLIFKWDRIYYFIQNGCLMHQQKTDVAGSVFLELKSDVTVHAIEIDDLKFTFQVNAQFPSKRTYYFQANNERDRNEWITILENAIKDENKSKLQSFIDNNKQMADNLINAKTSRSGSLTNAEPTFELSDSFMSNKGTNKMAKPQQGDVYKIRFLGSMNVKADKGNEYIHETIRQVMASRAKKNIFKMLEFNFIVNMESLSLFAVPGEEEDQPKSEQSNKDLLKARFDIGDLAFWATHSENQRLFGFIIKEKTPANVKFVCLVFESDVNSSQIMDSISNSAKLAYQLLIDENKSDHFKKMKQYERDILLQNINGLPDKQQSEDADQETDQALFNVAVNSPNPNFIVLDKEMLAYTLDLENETVLKRDQNVSASEAVTSSSAAGVDTSPGKASNESDA